MRIAVAKPHPLDEYPLNMMAGQCIHVADGDSIRVTIQLPLPDKLRGDFAIRFYDINAPEMSEVPAGPNAKAYMESLVLNKLVVVQIIARDDAHHRVLGKVFLPGGIDVGAEMVKAGHAATKHYE